MKNILIIGGSYFAGRVLVERLLKDGRHRVFIFNRGNVPMPHQGLTCLVGDREQPDQIKAGIPENAWHAVVDFCAYTPEHVRDLIHSLPGTVSHYFFISTTTIYEQTNYVSIAEEAPKLKAPQPELGHYADYGFNKWRAEKEVASLCDAKNIHYTIFRPAIIYGPYNYAPRESYFFDLIEKGREIVIPDNDLPRFSFLWVVDLANIILKCAGNENAFGEAFNVCGPEQVTYQMLIEILEKISEKKIVVQKMSAADIDAQQIPLPFPLDHQLVYSNDKIKKTIDYTFTPFEKGMAITYQFFKQTK